MPGNRPASHDSWQRVKREGAFHWDTPCTRTTPLDRHNHLEGSRRTRSSPTCCCLLFRLGMPSRRSFRSWGCIFPSYKSDTERPTAVKSSHLGRKKKRRRRREKIRGKKEGKRRETKKEEEKRKKKTSEKSEERRQREEEKSLTRTCCAVVVRVVQRRVHSIITQLLSTGTIDAGCKRH